MDTNTPNPQSEKKPQKYGHRPNYHRPKPQNNNETEGGNTISMRPGRYDTTSETEKTTDIVPTPANTVENKSSQKPYNRNNKNRYHNNANVPTVESESAEPTTDTAKPKYNNTRRPPKYNNRVSVSPEQHTDDAADESQPKRDFSKSDRKKSNIDYSDTSFKKRGNGYPHQHKHSGSKVQKNFDRLNNTNLPKEDAEDIADITVNTAEEIKTETVIKNEVTVTAGYDESALTDEKIAEELKKEKEADTDTIPAVFDISTVRIASKPRPNKSYYVPTVGVQATGILPPDTPSETAEVSTAAVKVADTDVSTTDTAETEDTAAQDKPEESVPVQKVMIIGVRFRSTGKIYYFDPENLIFNRGDAVIVDTARGIEYGTVDITNRLVNESEVVMPLRKVIRRATAEDIEHAETNTAKAAEAMTICMQKIIDHKLEMKLVDVEYAFDNSKLLFYFTADGRVDFRELVKDLASIFRTRIELRQIGIRDETKLLGGIGICGRAFCCKSFLSDFVQVSIKMAKEQNLSLNSLKISGACGRLMCCLRYEYDSYVEEIARTPKADQTVSTPDGDAVVTEVQPLAGLCRVRFLDNPDAPMKVYHRDQLAVIEK